MTATQIPLPCDDPAAVPGECAAVQLPGETIGRELGPGTPPPTPEPSAPSSAPAVVAEVGTAAPAPEPVPLVLAHTGVPVGPYVVAAVMLVAAGAWLRRLAR